MTLSKSTSSDDSRSFAGILMALIFGIVLLVTISEIVLRIAMPHWREYFSGWFMAELREPGLPAVTLGIPNFDGYFSQNNGDFRSHIHINEFGLRNDEPVSAADGRLWVIGDSMSFGWGVERKESYTQIIADKTGIPTYNVAGPGSNVCGWQTLYARMPKGVRPSIVVIGLTVENRMNIYDCEADGEKTRQAMPPDETSINLISYKRWLTENSALYNFVAVSLKRVNVVEMALEKVGLINDPDAFLLHGQDPSRADDMIRTTADELANLKRMLPAGTPYVVAVFPARFEIRDGNEYYRNLRVGVEAALAERNVDTVDLLEPFKAVGIGPTHFAHDGHWSPAGHRIAGEVIGHWLSQHGYVAKDPKQ